MNNFLSLIFVCLFFRRKLGWNDDNVVTKTLANFWVIFQPILFGLIGTEIQVSELDPNTVGLGIALLVIGLSIRDEYFPLLTYSCGQCESQYESQ